MKVNAWIIIDTHGYIINDICLDEDTAFNEAFDWDDREPKNAPHKAYKICNVRELDCYREELERRDEG